MSEHEGDSHGEEAPLSRAEIQCLVAESVTAALRSRDDSSSDCADDSTAASGSGEGTSGATGEWLITG